MTIFFSISRSIILAAVLVPFTIVAAAAESAAAAVVASPAADESVPPVVAKRYLISFKDEEVTPEERCASLASSTGGSVYQVYEHLNICSMTLPVERALTTIRNHTAVEFIEEDVKEKIHHDEKQVQADNIFASSSIARPSSSSTYSWGLDRLNQCKTTLDKKMAPKMSAKGVKVFIVDSGVHREHTEVKSSLGPKECHFSTVASGNVVHEQGTYVASLACGKTYGVAKDCTLCDVRVTDHAEAHRSAIFSGFNHIMGQCKGGSLCVVNLGFGNSGEQKPVQRTAMERLVSAVIVVVTSAGNVERDSCKGTFSASAAAIKVGNIDQKDKMVGSWGKCVTVFAPGTKVKGASIKSTTATALKTGTSSSTAYVTGIAAATRSKNKNYNPAQVKDAIMKSAVWLSANKNARSRWIYMATTGTNLKCPRPPTKVKTPGVNQAKPTFSPTTYGPSFTPTSSGQTFEPTSSTYGPTTYGPSSYGPSSYGPSTYFPSMDPGRGGKSSKTKGGKTKGGKTKAKAGKSQSKGQKI